MFTCLSFRLNESIASDDISSVTPPSIVCFPVAAEALLPCTTKHTTLTSSFPDRCQTTTGDPRGRTISQLTPMAPAARTWRLPEQLASASLPSLLRQIHRFNVKLTVLERRSTGLSETLTLIAQVHFSRLQPASSRRKVPAVTVRPGSWGRTAPRGAQRRMSACFGVAFCSQTPKYCEETLT